jgi:predicted unusual protein kinase regulating ubiquinone biosynthesis (AarF/ABC1/UbiB family)
VTVRVPAGRAARAARVAGLLADLAGDAARSGLLRLASRAGARDSDAALRAERIAATLSELRGAALKLGQFLSLQGEDALPAELRAALALLRDRAAFAPFSSIESVLRRELGSDWRAHFAAFDPEPLAAASIGQVHAAEARDGRVLALKIQYPGVARSIDGDVDLAALLLRGAGLLRADPEVAGLIERVKRELRREADYRREARSALAYRAWLSGDPHFEVPRVHADLSNARVLASDRVCGRPIEDLRSPEHPQSLRDRLGRALLELAFRELLELRRVQTDPNFANYLYLAAERKIALLDFGSLLGIPRELAAGYRALLRASVDGADRDLADAGIRLGFLRGDEVASARDRWLALARLAAEPLAAGGAYDFAASRLAPRVRARVAEAYRAGDLPPPPAEVLLVQRKLAGTFLLLQHIGARVDGRAVYERWA